MAVVMNFFTYLLCLQLMAGTNLVRTLVNAASCELPPFSDIVNTINRQQNPTDDGTTPVVTQLYYNCLQWNATLTQVERFIVSAELMSSARLFSERWVFVCQSGAFTPFQIESAAALFTNSSTSSFDFGECTPTGANASTGRSEISIS
jgi:hypothetical protein